MRVEIGKEIGETGGMRERDETGMRWGALLIIVVKCCWMSSYGHLGNYKFIICVLKHTFMNFNKKISVQ